MVDKSLGLNLFLFFLVLQYLLLRKNFLEDRNAVVRSGSGRFVSASLTNYWKKGTVSLKMVLHLTPAFIFKLGRASQETGQLRRVACLSMLLGFIVVVLVPTNIASKQDLF